MLRDGCRIIASGDLSRLPKKTQKVVYDAMEKTKEGKNFVFNICLNYGGKAEIVRAAKLFAEDVKNGKDISSLDENSFDSYLYTKDLPPVDLMVRTSGEERISNYMLWQLAYAEFIFTKTPWPDFTREELHKCIDEFNNRNRRYGEIKE